VVARDRSPAGRPAPLTHRACHNRSVRGARATIRVLALLACLATAGPAGAAAPASCPGAAIAPTQVVTGELGTAEQGAYVLVPFDVPVDTTTVRVKYCYDQPEAPSSPATRHTLDLGLYEPRLPGDELWSAQEFRGWGGSSHPDVTVSREGFSTEAQYEASPKGHVPGKTTRGFRPGRIPAGQWAVELGVAAVVPQTQGDSDGKVAWRVEIELTADPEHADEPYRGTRYDTTPARPAPGWYAGDFHVHAEHSSLGDATMTETFDYAFKPIAEGGAGLDFITLSDYVTNSAWKEIGRYQPDYPGNLIVRSSEVITYRGHINNHASVRYVDYRTGPVYRHAGDGSLELLRGPRPASAIFKSIQANGGWTQINHPTIFPALVPPFAILCRGCSWQYDDQETDYSKVDAIEIQTGPAGLQTEPEPGPNPFTPLAIQMWESKLDQGHRIAAVGSSDSHNAGENGGSPQDDILQSPIGHATTVVYAEELSERGVKRAVKAGHTYVKLFGNEGPDLRFQARAPGRPRAIMGDVLKAGSADFTARVIGGTPGEHQLFVFKDGTQAVGPVPVTSGDFTFPFPSLGPGRYRLQLQRGTAIDALTSPIYLRAP